MAQILNADETFLKVSEVMTSFKKETGHYPIRSDVLRYLPPPGFILTNLEDAFNRVKRGDLTTDVVVESGNAPAMA